LAFLTGRFRSIFCLIFLALFVKIGFILKLLIETCNVDLERCWTFALEMSPLLPCASCGGACTSLPVAWVVFLFLSLLAI
jgi:hypothetical protein